MIFNDDKDEAMMIAKMVKEDVEPEINPAVEAKKVAVKKMMDALKSDDSDSFMNAMDELKEIDRED